MLMLEPTRSRQSCPESLLNHTRVVVHNVLRACNKNQPAAQHLVSSQALYGPETVVGESGEGGGQTQELLLLLNDVAQNFVNDLLLGRRRRGWRAAQVY